MNQPQTQMLLAALGTMGQVAIAKHQHDREIASEQLRTGALAHLLDATIKGRVEAVKEGFLAVLRDYADQSQSYIRERERLSDKLMESTDLLLRNQLNDRINDIDARQQQIRHDAARLYHRMTAVIEALGVPGGDFAMSVSQPLQLPISQVMR